MYMSKSRDIQVKMPSPKVIWNAFWLVTVKVLNSYKIIIFGLIVTYIHNHEKCFFSSLQLSDA